MKQYLKYLPWCREQSWLLHIADTFIVLGLVFWVACLIPGRAYELNLAIGVSASTTGFLLMISAHALEKTPRVTLWFAAFIGSLLGLTAMALIAQFRGVNVQGVQLIVFGLTIGLATLLDHGFFDLTPNFNREDQEFTEKTVTWYGDLFRRGLVSLEVSEAALIEINKVQDFLRKEGNFRPCLPVSAIRGGVDGNEPRIVIGWTDTQTTLAVIVRLYDAKIFYHDGEENKLISESQFYEELAYLSDHILNEHRYSCEHENDDYDYDQDGAW